MTVEFTGANSFASTKLEWRAFSKKALTRAQVQPR